MVKDYLTQTHALWSYLNILILLHVLKSLLERHDYRRNDSCLVIRT